MRRAFTLIELLVVIGIMGLMGTITLGGYRAMTRGIEERGVTENVNHFIRSAYQRAQIDRQPVALYFWNQTRRAESETESSIVSGHAAAVLRSGRVSRCRAKGNYTLLFDEFSDIDKERLVVDSEDWETGDVDTGLSESDQSGALVPLYKMNGRGGAGSGRSLVSQTTMRGALADVQDRLLSNGQLREIPSWAYVVVDKGSVSSWNIGDAYGIEFAEIDLPNGYIFRNKYEASPDTQLTAGDYEVLWFEPGGSGESIEIYSLRPDRSGNVTPQLVTRTADPSRDLY